MHASKVLGSTAAAFALIGAIGFAYAQSENMDSNRSTTNAQMGSPPATTNTDPSMSNQPQSRPTYGTDNTSADSRAMSGERMARSDRN